MVVLDLPDAIFLDIVVSISGLNNISGCSHSEFIDSRVGGELSVLTDLDVAIEDLALRFLQKERVEVVLHRVEVCTGGVADSSKKDRASRVSARNDSRVAGGQSVVPQLKKGAHFPLGHSILSLRRSIELPRLQCVHSEQVELRARNLASIVGQSQSLRDAGRRGEGLRGRDQGKSDGDGRELHL